MKAQPLPPLSPPRGAGGEARDEPPLVGERRWTGARSWTCLRSSRRGARSAASAPLPGEDDADYTPEAVRDCRAGIESGLSDIFTAGLVRPDAIQAAFEGLGFRLLAAREVDGLLIASSALTERHRSWIDERPCPVVPSA